MKEILKNKNGISLIVLVITIIVMIILSAVIILSINSSEIISKANQSEKDYSKAQYKEAAIVAIAELELEDGVTALKLEEKLKEMFGDNTTVREENENYVITINGDVNNVVTIPTNKTTADNTEPETFEFSFTNHTLTAEEGMTWAEWALSNYNTGYDNTRYGIYEGDIILRHKSADVWFKVTFVSGTTYTRMKPTDVMSSEVINGFDYGTESEPEYSSGFPAGAELVEKPNT